MTSCTFLTKRQPKPYTESLEANDSRNWSSVMSNFPAFCCRFMSSMIASVRSDDSISFSMETSRPSRRKKPADIRLNAVFTLLNEGLKTMESFIFTVRREDEKALSEAFEKWAVNNRPHVRLAFDSMSPTDLVQVMVDGITSPAALNCLSASLGYFIARNKGKKFKVKTKDGFEFVAEGHSLADTSKLLDKALAVRVEDEEPT